MISLGLDCGTQSTKCIALEVESGKIIASAQASHQLISGLPPGAMEQDPAEWTNAAATTIQQVLEKLGSKKEQVRCIGVSGQQHGLVVLDEKDEVVRPAKLWCDTSTAAQCESLTRALGGVDKAIEETGNAVLPGYTSPKILWLKENEPENYAKVRSILLPHDYLNFWLTGQKTMEFGDASGTGLLNVEERKWSEAVLQAIGSEVAEFLPSPGTSLGMAGVVRHGLLEEWGLSGPIAVSAGGGDNMMGAIGTGNVSSGVVTVSLGTSGTLYAFSNSPVVDPKGEVAAFCDSTDHWLPLVCTMNVTLVTELAGGLFGWDHGTCDREAAKVAPGSNGLLLLPYLTGERTPNLPRATGTWTGLTVDNFRPAHLVRSAMEGVTLGLGYGLGRFRELGLEPSEIRLTGGGSNSPLWRQIAADVFGVPTVCLESGEGAALGAAIQALSTWSREQGSDERLFDFTNRLIKLDDSTRSEPNPEAVGVYREMAQRANHLRQALQTPPLA